MNWDEIRWRERKIKGWKALSRSGTAGQAMRNRGEGRRPSVITTFWTIKPNQMVHWSRSSVHWKWMIEQRCHAMFISDDLAQDGKWYILFTPACQKDFIVLALSLQTFGGEVKKNKTWHLLNSEKGTYEYEWQTRGQPLRIFKFR